MVHFDAFLPEDQSLFDLIEPQVVTSSSTW